MFAGMEFNEPAYEMCCIEDKELCERVWTGVVPIKTVWGTPEATAYSGAKVPAYICKMTEETDKQ